MKKYFDLAIMGFLIVYLVLSVYGCVQTEEHCNSAGGILVMKASGKSECVKVQSLERR